MITNRSNLEQTPVHEIALNCLEAGIEAAHPRTFVDQVITVDEDILIVDETRYDLSTYSTVMVIGGGNAASQIAAVLEEKLGAHLDNGIVITDDPAQTQKVDVRYGTHPTPSREGVESTREVLETAEAANDDTLILGIITGGGSSLLTAPAANLEVSHLQKTTEELLASGATIHEMNTVRKHLSNVKGGRLASAAAPATVVGLVVSDVVGNDLEVIASGPLVPDSTTYADALTVIEKYELQVPIPVLEHLRHGIGDEIKETPARNEDIFSGVDIHLLADGKTALNAAERVARESGYETMLLSSRIRGEAHEAAKTHVAVIEEAVSTGNPLSLPAVILSGGETTVTLDGEKKGKGGPNLEFGLSAALELSAKAVIGSVDTDGIDGNSGVAGAIIDETTIGDGQTFAQKAIKNNNSLPFLRERKAAIETGPTGTNVNDFRVCVIPTQSGEEKH